MSDLHGDSDSVRHEVPGDVERGTSRPGGQELSRRTQVQHQNIGFRCLPQHLQLRLLPGRGQGSAADTLDGLGVGLTCEFIIDTHLTQLRFDYHSADILTTSIMSLEL